MSNLAIIIPAYKASFLQETLESLRSQSDRNFNVYIGDDHSPHDLEAIVRPFCQELNIHYVRFDNNIGARSLVAQWERCIKLTRGEDWLWMFADDDIAERDCVKEFWNTLQATQHGYDIYTFNTTVIDQNGKLISPPPQVPISETAVEYAYNLLSGKRANCMSDHVFSAAAYAKNRGFVHTDYAQAADWLNSILLAARTGIRLIPGPTVHWRYSGSNISSLAHTRKAETIKGHLQFIQWILDHFAYLKDRASTITYEQMRAAALANLKSVLITHYRGVNAANILPVLLFIKTRFKMSLLASLRAVWDINSRAARI